MTDFISVTEASKITGITDRHIRTLCAEGKIEGINKIGRNWCIPSEWAKQFSEEKHLETAFPLSLAAEDAGISHAAMVKKVKSGEVKGYSERVYDRDRWWVDREAFWPWLKQYKEKQHELMLQRAKANPLPPLPDIEGPLLPEEGSDYTFENFCTDRGILPADSDLNRYLIEWDIYREEYLNFCKANKYYAENLDRY